MAFLLSKIGWVLMAPGNALFIVGLFGAFMAGSRKRARQRTGGRICLLVSLIGITMMVLPVGDWLLIPLENKARGERPSQVDGIILLGGSEDPYVSAMRQQPSLRYSASRYLTFASLARQYPDAQLLFTGGSGALSPHETMSEADVARDVLTELGLPQSNIVYENRSRNTYQNAVYSKKLVHPKPEQKWLLVTSAAHMMRALAVFRKAGWDVYPIPADYMTGGAFSPPFNFSFLDHLYKTTLALHEYGGLVAYRMMGYTDTLWVE